MVLNESVLIFHMDTKHHESGNCVHGLPHNVLDNQDKGLGCDDTIFPQTDEVSNCPCPLDRGQFHRGCENLMPMGTGFLGIPALFHPRIGGFILQFP
jgi:hypothetical protein